MNDRTSMVGRRMSRIYQFTDAHATNLPARFYLLRWP